MIPVFTARHVEEAVSPARALEAVREAFLAYHRGEWSMPPKVYVPAYPAGDFRAMPVLGGGHAALKWVTSFPGNPERGLPTVSGLVLLSDASDGSLRAVFDAGAVTALRTGAAAVLAAETLGRSNAENAAVVGAGVNGRAAARTFIARGREVALWDVDEGRARGAALGLGAAVADSRGKAPGAGLVVTMTPRHEGLLPPPPVFWDDGGRASHNGELVHAVETGAMGREQVTELGAVLAGEAEGRRSDDEITTFDSTGLAIQDLAIALAALDRTDELDLPTIEL